MSPALEGLVFGLLTTGAAVLVGVAPLGAIWLGCASWGHDSDGLRRSWAFRGCLLTWALWTTGAVAVALALPTQSLIGPGLIGPGPLLRIALTAGWVAMVSGGMLVWMIGWAGVGACLRAFGELCFTRLPRGAQIDPTPWPRPDPVHSAVTLATLVCLARLWLSP